ncbi:MAG: hypothetical protein WAM30_10705 [Candidatus Dormiibacterota bacterium]
MTAEPYEVRYFERRQIHEAIAFAEAGGIAVHRNLDSYHGRRSRGGIVMRKPFVHVIGLRPVLMRWAREHAVPVAAIQPEGKRRVAHVDVFGQYAEGLIAQLHTNEM